MFLESFTRLLPSIVILIVFIGSVWILKPNFMFKNTGQLRVWGVGVDEYGYKKTLFDLRWCIILVCILTMKQVNGLDR